MKFPNLPYALSMTKYMVGFSYLRPSGTSVKRSYNHGMRNREASHPPAVLANRTDVRSSPHGME